MSCKYVNYISLDLFFKFQLMLFIQSRRFVITSQTYYYICTNTNVSSKNRLHRNKLNYTLRNVCILIKLKMIFKKVAKDLLHCLRPPTQNKFTK